MYCLLDFCCICFNNKEKLSHLSASDNKNITYFFKLTSAVPEMQFNEMNQERLICEKCSENIDFVYKFRLNCLRSKVTLTDYISKLHQISNINGTVNVLLTDINKKNSKEDYLPKNIDNGKKLSSINLETNSNPISLKLYDSGPNFIRLGNVEIKLERLDQNSKKHVEYFTRNTAKNIADDINEKENQENIIESCDINTNQEEVTAAVGYNDFIVTACENQVEENYNVFLEPFKNENNITEENLEEENYFFNLETSSDESMTNSENFKIDIVHNDIESTNAEINTTQTKNIEDLLETYHDFSSQDKIFRVEDTTDEVIPETYDCKICEQKFNNFVFLTEHMRIHTGKKPKECNICKMFNASANLTKIISTPKADGKPYQCSICQKKFDEYVNETNLEKHVRFPAGKKTVQCNVCKDKFRLPLVLTQQMKVHVAENSFVCWHCKKKFKNSVKLKKHMSTHSSKKLLECWLCQKTFYRRYKLSQHMKEHL